jgi:ribosomal protein S16
MFFSFVYRYWLSVGAQPSDTVRNILYKQGVMAPPNSPEPALAAEA